MNKIMIIIGSLVVMGGVGYGIFSYTESQKQAQLAALGPVASPTSNARYTLNDVAAHGSTANCWMAVNGKVYDATKYIESGMHNPEIAEGCGHDATAMFSRERKHQGAESQDILTKLYIGDLSN